MFEKAFIFVPIHGRLHWSLAIIAIDHGVLVENTVQITILHLDSNYTGAHHPTTKSSSFSLLELWSFLQHEWLARVNANDTEVSFPKAWEREHGTQPSFNANASIKELKKMALVSTFALPHLPRQENGFDCGLFMLCSLEYFCHANPKKLQLQRTNKALLEGKCRSEDNVSTF